MVEANVSASMNEEKFYDPDPCVVAGVQPFLNELQQPVAIRAHGEEDPNRSPTEHFMRRVFLLSYGAMLNNFYPTLLSFTSGQHLRAAVGVRDAVRGPVFAEQYLSAPAEKLISDHWGQRVGREALVEVGNLALDSPGEARWVIAAVTIFLHSCGYRWVLFTAVRPLFNAFQRLGLNPIQFADADPALLPDGGRDWGNYYDERPVVCVGDIQSGYHKLTRFVSHNQPMLRALLDEALHQAISHSCRDSVRLEGIR